MDRYNFFNGRRNRRLDRLLDILKAVERRYIKEHAARIKGMRGLQRNCASNLVGDQPQEVSVVENVHTVVDAHTKVMPQ